MRLGWEHLVVALAVGILLGAAFSVWAQQPRGLQPPLEWKSIQGGMARLEIAQDGVVCYARVGGGPGGIHDLTCLKVK